MTAFTLEIVTPYGRFRKATAESALFSTLDGQLEILGGHAPLVVDVAPCVLRVRGPDGAWVAAVSEGFATIRTDAVTLLVDSAEMAGDIDVDRARAALQRAQERLSSGTAAWIQTASRKAAARAIARIKAAGQSAGRPVAMD